LDLQTERLTAYVQELAAGVNRPARDARFRYRDGAVIVTQESQDGLEVDVGGTVRAIQEAFRRSEATGALGAKVEEPAFEAGGRRWCSASSSATGSRATAAACRSDSTTSSWRRAGSMACSCRQTGSTPSTRRSGRRRSRTGSSGGSASSTTARGA